MCTDVLNVLPPTTGTRISTSDNMLIEKSLGIKLNLVYGLNITYHNFLMRDYYNTYTLILFLILKRKLSYQKAVKDEGNYF